VTRVAGCFKSILVCMAARAVRARGRWMALSELGPVRGEVPGFGVTDLAHAVDRGHVGRKGPQRSLLVKEPDRFCYFCRGGYLVLYQTIISDGELSALFDIRGV